MIWVNWLLKTQMGDFLRIGNFFPVFNFGNLEASVYRKMAFN